MSTLSIAKKLSFAAASVAFIALGSGGAAKAAEIVNGSFETGDFTGWITNDLTDPFFPLQVDDAGVTPGFGLFSSAPTDGKFAALHGFDGNGPGIISLAQDVFIETGITTLTFDFRAGWDMQNFFGSSLDRLFEVNIETAGGGANLLNENFLTAEAGSINLDTGNLSGTLDLSAFAGQNVRVKFDSFIPEDFTGPAFFQLDNVALDNEPATAVPEPATILGSATALGFGALLKRRNSKKQNKS